MTLEERKSVNSGLIQNLILENREKLSVSGVLDVLSFDDQVVIMDTELGMLTIKGDNLRINKLSIDTSEVFVVVFFFFLFFCVVFGDNFFVFFF